MAPDHADMAGNRAYIRHLVCMLAFVVQMLFDSDALILPHYGLVSVSDVDYSNSFKQFGASNVFLICVALWIWLMRAYSHNASGCMKYVPWLLQHSMVSLFQKLDATTFLAILW